MALEVYPSEATLGTVVTGLDLARLGDVEWCRLESLFHEFAVLVLPDQHLTRSEQVAFGRRFGELDPLVGEAGTIAISNQRPDGSLLEDDDPVVHILRGNEDWHTDSSYMPIAAKVSILAAEVLPPTGGETEWADMRAAFEALDPERREQVSRLTARHSLKRSQAKLGYTKPSANSYGFEEIEPPLRPLVKVHPVTGRSSLFIGRHAYGVAGMGEVESERLLEELLQFACQPPRVWRHSWQPGDVAIWDNRCVLHRARPYDRSKPRVLHHTRIAGDPATEAAVGV